MSVFTLQTTLVCWRLTIYHMCHTDTRCLQERAVVVRAHEMRARRARLLTLQRDVLALQERASASVSISTLSPSGYFESTRPNISRSLTSPKLSSSTKSQNVFVSNPSSELFLAGTERGAVSTTDDEEGSSVSEQLFFSTQEDANEHDKENEEEEVVIVDAEGGVRVMPLRGDGHGGADNGAAIDGAHENTSAAGNVGNRVTWRKKLWGWMRGWV